MFSFDLELADSFTEDELTNAAYNAARILCESYHQPTEDDWIIDGAKLPYWMGWVNHNTAYFEELKAEFRGIAINNDPFAMLAGEIEGCFDRQHELLR